MDAITSAVLAQREQQRAAAVRALTLTRKELANAYASSNDRCAAEPVPADVVRVLDLAAYDRSLVDQAVLAVDDVHRLTGRLLALPRAQRLELPWLHPGRADVIGAGVLILDRVLRRTGVGSLVVSEADILDGIAWSLV